MRPIINVDLDGVVYDFVGSLYNYYRTGQSEEVAAEEYPEPEVWEFWNNWGMSFGEWNNIFRRGVEAGQIWRKGQAIPSSARVMWRLSDKEYHIRIVTSRLNHFGLHREAVQNTAEWLHWANIPYRSLVFVGPEGKGDLGGEYMVDDRPENLQDWVRNNPDGKGYLFDYRHNRWFRENEQIIRVAGWDELYRYIPQGGTT